MFIKCRNQQLVEPLYIFVLLPQAVDTHYYLPTSLTYLNVGQILGRDMHSEPQRDMTMSRIMINNSIHKFKRHI